MFATDPERAALRASADETLEAVRRTILSGDALRAVEFVEAGDFEGLERWARGRRCKASRARGDFLRVES